MIPAFYVFGIAGLKLEILKGLLRMLKWLGKMLLRSLGKWLFEMQLVLETLGSTELKSGE